MSTSTQPPVTNAPVGANVSGLRKTFGRGRTVAIEHLDITMPSGELLVLLGPSGCGKSTTLRCIAGLDTPDQGAIELGGTVVYSSRDRVDAMPEDRDLGMVFQNYALWSHMTVRDNINYPLASRRMRTEMKEGWAESMAELVECGHLLDRLPAQLSGGQQQRIALARALVARPSVLLFDEPLSNLDARLRHDLRSEIKSLHRQLGFTGLYVTHDQVEALAIADRIAIMNHGRIVQLDTPERVYRRPGTRWAADFMGATSHIDGAGGTHPFVDSRAAEVCFRPSDAMLTRADDHPDPASPAITGGTVADVIFAGGSLEYHVDVADTRIMVHQRTTWDGPSPVVMEPGANVTVHVAASDLLAYDDEGLLVGETTHLQGVDA